MRGGKRLRTPEPAERQPEGRSEGAWDLYCWLQAVVLALTVILLCFTFVGRIERVEGESMFPTLADGSLMLVQSLGYTPRQGDVVVVSRSDFLDRAIVKRVIATGGQTVDIDYAAGTVSVDGQVLDEPYIREEMEDKWGFEDITHLTVPEGSLFLLGDNRNASTDSRYPGLGAVDERCVLGRACFVVFPFDRLGAIS